MPHSMCYSHLGNGVSNGAISIMQRGFISGCYKVKSIGQWGKILVMAMGFVDHLGQYLETLFSLLLGDESIVPDQKEIKRVKI